MQTGTAQDSADVTGMHDEQYNIVSVLYHALKGAATYAEYLRDAEEADDQELVSFFQQAVEENRQRAERARNLLAKRITSAQQRAA
jgi:hypothetical protein